MAKHDPKKTLEKRVAFLAKREGLLTSKVSSIEKRLFALLTEAVFSKIDTKDGLIKSSKGNLTITAAINKVFKQFNRDINSKVVSQFTSDLLSTMDLQDGYFREFGSKKQFDRIKSKSRGVMNARLGITAKGTPIEGGFMHNFLNDSSLKNKVVNNTVAAISGKVSISQFKEQMSVLVKGAPDAVGGQLQAQYRQFAYDTYAESDRTYGQLWADELKMTSFLYLGGVIKNTRQFCCERNGLIFTVEEAQKWKGLNFSGKPSFGYNPITQLGGYGCRHSNQWIDDEQAVLLRKDLEIKDGKLQKKPGSGKQKLNTGCSKRS